jgi:hypothetical protein
MYGLVMCRLRRVAWFLQVAGDGSKVLGHDNLS